MTNKITSDPNIQTTLPVIDEYISSNTLKSLIEQHQTQQTIVKYSSSSPTNYPESLDLSEYQPNKNISGRKSATSKRSRPPPPTHLPKLIKKPEPIPVTLDQFQAVRKTLQIFILNLVFLSS